MLCTVCTLSCVFLVDAIVFLTQDKVTPWTNHRWGNKSSLNLNLKLKKYSISTWKRSWKNRITIIYWYSSGVILHTDPIIVNGIAAFFICVSLFLSEFPKTLFRCFRDIVMRMLVEICLNVTVTDCADCAWLFCLHAFNTATDLVYDHYGKRRGYLVQWPTHFMKLNRKFICVRPRHAVGTRSDF